MGLGSPSAEHNTANDSFSFRRISLSLRWILGISFKTSRHIVIFDIIKHFHITINLRENHCLLHSLPKLNFRINCWLPWRSRHVSLFRARDVTLGQFSPNVERFSICCLTVSWTHFNWHTQSNGFLSRLLRISFFFKSSVCWAKQGKALARRRFQFTYISGLIREPNGFQEIVFSLLFRRSLWINQTFCKWFYSNALAWIIRLKGDLFIWLQPRHITKLTFCEYYICAQNHLQFG